MILRYHNVLHPKRWYFVTLIWLHWKGTIYNLRQGKYSWPYYVHAKMCFYIDWMSFNVIQFDILSHIIRIKLMCIDILICWKMMRRHTRVNLTLYFEYHRAFLDDWWFRFVMMTVYEVSRSNLAQNCKKLVKALVFQRRASGAFT